MQLARFSTNLFATPKATDAGMGPSRCNVVVLLVCTILGVFAYDAFAAVTFPRADFQRPLSFFKRVAALVEPALATNKWGSDAAKKANERFLALIEEMPLKELAPRLENVRLSNVKLLEAAVARALKDEKDAHAADLLAWVATSAYYLPVGQKAATTLLDKYPDHESVARVVGTRSDPPPASKARAELTLGPAMWQCISTPPGITT